MIYHVLCIDDLGIASWESVEFKYVDQQNDFHGYIKRTGMYVKFWENDSGDDYIGTTYKMIDNTKQV